jgi:hypothetical protein
MKSASVFLLGLFGFLKAPSCACPCSLSSFSILLSWEVILPSILACAWKGEERERRRNDGRTRRVSKRAREGAERPFPTYTYTHTHMHTHRTRYFTLALTSFSFFAPPLPKPPAPLGIASLVSLYFCHSSSVLKSYLRAEGRSQEKESKKG